MTRVLFWTDVYRPSIGGIESFSQRLLGPMQARGYEFLVVTGSAPGAPAFEIDNGVVVHRLPLYEALRTRGARHLAEVHRTLRQVKLEFAPHLYHINLSGPGVFFHLATRDAAPAPVLVSAHGRPLLPLSDDHSIARVLLRSADWFTNCSAASRQLYLDRMPDLQSKSSVAYLGVPKSGIPEAPLPNSPYLLWLRTMIPEKGPDLALRAFAEVSKAFPLVRLCLAGDGPVRLEMEQLARSLGVEARVEFVGAVAPESVAPLVNRSTLLLVPSRMEGFGYVVLEAALLGRPTIATRVEGLCEAVVDGETGILVEPESPGALAEAIVRLLQSPAEITRLGRAARHRALREFTVDRMVQTFETLYRALLQ